MITFTLFAISGAALVTITISKRIEEKKKRTVLILRAISQGDERLRELRYKALQAYSLGKERLYFVATKQAPLKAKSFWNRFAAYMREVGKRYAGDIRNSKLLRRSDGISEFFKSISEIEKGNGEIDKPFEEFANQEAVPSVVLETTRPRKQEFFTRRKLK